MLLAVIGWVLFRAETIADAIDYLAVMFFVSGNPLTDANAIVFFQENLVFLICGVIFSAPVAKVLARKADALGTHGTADTDAGNAGSPGRNTHVLSGAVSALYVAAFTAVFLLAMSYLVKGTHNPFIYFNF